MKKVAVFFTILIVFAGFIFMVMWQNSAANSPELRPDDPTATPSSSLPEVDAVSGGGIGVISDSNSEPYQKIGRGTEKSYTWTELLHDWRGVNFGNNLEFVTAVSGDRTKKIDSQITQLEPFIKNGEIETILIWIGINNTRPMCNSAYNESDAASLEETMLTHFEDGIKRLLRLGVPPESIYMVDQPDVTVIRSCKNGEQLAAFIADINVKLADLADNYGIHLIDSRLILSEIRTYVINDKGDLMIDGELIRNQNCDEPDCLFLSDNHANTVLNGLIANAYFADVIGFEKLSDNEIVRAAGLK